MPRSLVSLAAFFLSVLAGCDSPSPAFLGVPATRVTVEGSTFSVRARADEAEAIRTSAERLTRRSEIVARGAVAIEIATGCKVDPDRVYGDQSVISAQLDCP